MKTHSIILIQSWSRILEPMMSDFYMMWQTFIVEHKFIWIVVRIQRTFSSYLNQGKVLLLQRTVKNFAMKDGTRIKLILLSLEQMNKWRLLPMIILHVKNSLWLYQNSLWLYQCYLYEIILAMLGFASPVEVHHH